MAFQKGHKLSTGPKKDVVRFYDVLHRAIKQDDADRLRRAAERLLDLAAEGEPWAAKELMDRLDGKAKQQIEAVIDANVQFGETVAKATDIRGKLRNPTA